MKQAGAGRDGRAGTEADYRAAMLGCLELVTDGRDQDESEAAALLPHWSAGASDVEVNSWLRLLRPRPYRVRGAARIALRRAIDGDVASAKAFLDLAHAALAPETPEALLARGKEPKDKWAFWGEAASLVPAWWRLGHADWAKKAFATFEATWPFIPAGVIVRDGVTYAAPEAYHALRLATFAGQADLAVPRLVPRSSDQRRQMVADVGPALAVLYAGGGEEAFHAAMTALHPPIQDEPRVDAAPAWNDALSFSLFLHLLQRGRPGVYPRLFARYPLILTSSFVRCALREVEQRDPAEAVELAAWLLDGKHLVDAPWRTRLEPVAILAKHAPIRADAWAAGPEGAKLIDNDCEGHPLVGRWRGTRLAVLAALGHDARLRRIYAAARAKRTGEVERDDRVAIAAMTGDPALAREMLLAIDDDPTVHAPSGHTQEQHVDSLAMLDALGERAYVDRWLKKELKRANPKPGQKFSLGLAPELGRADLGVAALKFLGPRGSPRILAQSDRYLDGLTDTGQWGRALEVLEALPPERRFSRMMRAFSARAEMRRLEARYSPVRATVGPGRP